MNPTNRDAYGILQIDPAAEATVLKAAFHALARRYHPDGEAPDTARMAVLNGAYALVRSPELRRAYDGKRAVLQAAGTGHGPPLPAATPPGSGSASGGLSARTAQRNGRNARPDSPTLEYGRYAGWRLAELMNHDPDYLRWLSRHSSGLHLRREINRLLSAVPEHGRRSASAA